MRFEEFSFGSIQIDGFTYEHDVVIDHGEIRKRKKKVSKKFRDAFGHTPLSVEEDLPWKCRRLVQKCLPTSRKCAAEQMCAKKFSTVLVKPDRVGFCSGIKK